MNGTRQIWQDYATFPCNCSHQTMFGLSPVNSTSKSVRLRMAKAKQGVVLGPAVLEESHVPPRNVSHRSTSTLPLTCLYLVDACTHVIMLLLGYCRRY